MLQTKTSNGNVENAQLRFGSSRLGSFFDTSPLLFRFRPTLWEPLG